MSFIIIIIRQYLAYHLSFEDRVLAEHKGNEVVRLLYRWPSLT